jgi:hypothetical protein
MILNDEFRIVLKETILAYLKIMLPHFAGGTEENYGQLQSRVTGPLISILIAFDRDKC